MFLFNHNQTKLRKAIIFIIVLLPSLIFAIESDELPDFGDSAGAVISPEYDRRLGQLFLRQVRQFAQLNKDPEITSYIQSIGYQIASHSDNPELSFTFFVVNDSAINAFAGPGGMIGMNSGVILNSGNESELAAVMAHEIAHVTQRHLARTFEEASKYGLAKAAALLGAVVIAIANPEAGAAAIAGVTGLSAQNQINFTRANEEEADRVGMQTLVRAGYDPRGMPAFFEKLQQISRFSQSAAPEFLRTHPLTTTRIADSIARAESFPKKQFTNSHSYNLVRYKIFVNSSKTPKDAAASLQNELNKSTGTAKEKLPIRYGLAHAYIGDRDFSRAEQQIKILLNDNPDDVAYLLMAAKLETKRPKYDAAFKIFKKAYALYPDYRPVVIAYTRALLDVNKAKEARDIMKNYERHHSHDLDTYSLLGQAEGMLGNEIETAILQSEYYYLAGATNLAVNKLKFIKQQYQLDYYQEQRVSARMAELEYELELEEKIKL